MYLVTFNVQDLHQGWVVVGAMLSNWFSFSTSACRVKLPTESVQGTTCMPCLVRVYHTFGGSVGNFVDAFLWFLVGKGVIPFVLLAQVDRDQQVQFLLRGELSELHLRRSISKQH